MCKSFRKKLILFIEKYLPNKKTVEYSYWETFGEEIKINDNFIYQKAKKYLIDNTTPQINDYLDGFFEDSEIKNSDLIYEMEFSEKYIQTYFEEYKSKRAVYNAIGIYFFVKVVYFSIA